MSQDGDIDCLIARINKSSNFYEILGVENDVDVAALTKAYRKLALKLHPDKCSVDGSQDAFKKVSNAFGVLKDKDQRAHYDRFGSESTRGTNHQNPFSGFDGGEVDVNELFAQMFRDHPAFRGMGPGQARRGGGMPGGVHFSFNGAPFSRRGQNDSQFRREDDDSTSSPGLQIPLLPAPIQAVVNGIISVVPVPFLMIGFVFFLIYAVNAIVKFVFRNFFYFIALSYLPIPKNLKAYAWLAFFGCGILGVL